MTSTTLRLVEPLAKETKPAGPVPRYNLRATLPDRPGALGALAAALGRTGADIVSVSVVERDRFDAVDDVTFELPGPVRIDEVYAALHSVNGLWIESLHEEVCGSALTEATALLASVARQTPDRMPHSLVNALPDVLGATWAAIWPESGRRSPVVASAATPSDAPRGLHEMTLPCAATGGRLWLTPAPRGELEVAVVPFSAALALGVGRRGGPPFRATELDILEHIATVAVALFAVRR
ncbi:MAG: ACT domain-containing protein [Actinomycetes bacterium]